MFKFLNSLVLTSVALSAIVSRADESYRAIQVVGSDHPRPFSAYLEIQKIISTAVATGRTRHFVKSMKSFEGHFNFCIGFDETASNELIHSVKNELLNVSGISEEDRNAVIGKLFLGQSCSIEADLLFN